MGVSFIRRFLFDPGNQILLNIESVNVLDLTPPSPVQGVGTGVACLVGEFEDGPFNFPTQIASPSDLANIFGTLGYTYGGVQANNCSAIARFADGAVVPEYWNGNGFVQLNAKQFASLVLVRANTGAGTVQLTPQAFITGAAAFRYKLASGQAITLDLGPSSAPATATFTGVAAAVTGGAYVGSMVTGDSVTLAYDGGAPFTVYFQTGDTTVVQAIARINQYAGFAFASNSAGDITLTGLVAGTLGEVQVVSASAGVLVKLALVVANTFGTGNVGNVAAVSPQEVASVIQAAVAGSRVELDQNNALRISNTTTPGTGTILVTATTATALGFVVGQSSIASNAAWVAGTAYTAPAAGMLTLRLDAAAPFTVTFAGGELIAAAVTLINTAAGFTLAYADHSNTTINLIGRSQGGGGKIAVSGAGALLTSLGFTSGTTVAPPQVPGSIPAGTVVQTASGQSYVTMQSVYFTNGQVVVGALSAADGGVIAPVEGPWNVPVRAALDNGSDLGTGAGAIVTVTSAPAYTSLFVTNLQPITAALTETQIDVAYQSALDTTLNVSSVAKTINIIWSARQSNHLRNALSANAVTASASGLVGRIAPIRTPLNTNKYTAMSINAEPGVGAYRNQRVIYCYPQARTYVPIIALRGTSGNPVGTGYTAFTPDGNVDVGADGFLCAIMSQLAPEENPGQLTPFSGGIVSLESGLNAQGFMIGDYVNFKAAGICALRFDTDDGVAIFQSGVTSVDPTVNPGLVRISRRRMADYIQDSLANAMMAFGKKLSTQARRKAIVGEINQFLYGLLSKENPSNQRIGGYAVDPNSANTAATLQQGLYRIVINVQTLPSLDSIVLQTTVGEEVAVTETLPVNV